MTTGPLWKAWIAVAAVVVQCAAFAQDYPTRPIRFVVPFTPGAGTDTTARIVAQRLSVLLGQPVVVDNKGGASGMIGTNIVAKAAPDGYTWVLGHDPAFTSNTHMVRKMAYEPLRDFAPVSVLVNVPVVLIATPGLKANNLRELIAMARENPGKITFSSAGNGTVPHLATEVLMAATGMKLYHIPFRGQAEALTDLMAGRVDLTFSSIANVVSLAQTGKVKILAIGSPKRFPGLPDVPTIAESGYPGFDVSAWHGLLMPAGTPPAIVRKVNAAVAEVLRMPEVAARFESLGLFPVGGTPEAMGQMLESESAKWAKVIRDAGIKAE